MLFNSIQFFIFFAIVYLSYRLLNLRGQNWLLLVAGYVFYGWWDVRFLFLIAFSTTVDYWIGLMLADGRVPRRERVTASFFIVGAAALFLGIDWKAIAASGSLEGPLLWPLGVRVFLLTIVIVLLANAFYDRVASMRADSRRRLLLATTVAVNLGFLAIFKYFNFFIGSATVALQSLGWNPLSFHLEVVLPVGISFYTFQSLSYTIDASRGLVRPARRFWDFALFVAFFPPMVAGPIERARHLLPQLQRARKLTLKQSLHGVVLILYGLFKKVAIADGLAVPVNAVFNSTGVVSARDIAVASVFFALQIFCDFSGYTDIARGVAKLLGFELVINFNLPYLSRNPSEFWRRWHISLSTWLRDYLYISLGGNRKGSLRTYINLMATMALGGLWHGAAWNYVIWGVYQGALLCIHRAFTGEREGRFSPDLSLSSPPTLMARISRGSEDTARIFFFFVFICYGWLLFRAHSFSQIATFSETLLGMGPRVASVMRRPALATTAGLLIVVILQVVEYLDGRPECFRFWPRPIQGGLYAAMIFILAMGMSNAPTQFIYFQF